MTDEQREAALREALGRYGRYEGVDISGVRRSPEYNAARFQYRVDEEHSAEYRRLVGRVTALLPAPAHVLELGSGTGGWCTALALAGYQVTGLEPDEPGVRVSELRALRYPATRQAFHVGFAERMPFGDASFDAVVSTQVLEHIDDRPAAIRECLRVLRPGGVTMHLMPNYAFPYEAHYRIPWPTRASRKLGRRYLQLLRRSPELFDVSIFPTLPGPVLQQFRDAGFVEVQNLYAAEVAAKLERRQFTRGWMTRLAGGLARIGALWLLRTAILGLELYPAIVVTARRPDADAGR